MQVAGGTGDVHLHRTYAAQGHRQRRLIRVELAAVGTDRDVAGELLLIACQEIADLRASDLLLAFVAQLHIDRKPAFGLQEAFQRHNGGKHVSLAVRSPAGRHLVAGQPGFEGRMIPQIQGVDGLNIEVPVDQHRGLAGGVQPVAVHDRMAPCLHDLRVLQPGLHDAVGHPLGSASHIRGMFRQGRDAWEPEEFEVLLHEPVLMRIKVLLVFHTGPIRCQVGSQESRQPGLGPGCREDRGIQNQTQSTWVPP